MRSILHLAVAAALAASLANAEPLAAQTTVNPPAPAAAGPSTETSSSAAYKGEPALQLTLAMVMAGGAERFRSTSLFSMLAGERAESEADKLRNQFGQDRMVRFFRVADFVVVDTLHIFDSKEIPRPDAPNPDPTDGRALAMALYKAGRPAETGAFSVEYLLDHLMSHAVHQQVVQDVGEQFGADAYPSYAEVFGQTMNDLKDAYAF